GGVIGSFFEYLQNMRGETWLPNVALTRMLARISRTLDLMFTYIQENRSMTPRQAAYRIALQNLLNFPQGLPTMTWARLKDVLRTERNLKRMWPAWWNLERGLQWAQR